LSRDPIQKLIFVYNADTGLGNSLLDTAHKILSPGTYSCRLCELTFGAFREKSLWRKFREASDVPMEFLHRDEFSRQYSSKFMPAYTFPVILAQSDHDLEVFLNTVELNALDRTDELIREVAQRINR
jgi:hypothetical protein